MHRGSFYLVYFGQPEGHQTLVFSGSAYLYVARIKFKIFIKSPFGNITGRGIAAQASGYFIVIITEISPA